MAMLRRWRTSLPRGTKQTYQVYNVSKWAGNPIHLRFSTQIVWLSCILKYGRLSLLSKAQQAADEKQVEVLERHVARGLHYG